MLGIFVRSLEKRGNDVWGRIERNPLVALVILIGSIAGGVGVITGAFQGVVEWFSERDTVRIELRNVDFPVGHDAESSGSNDRRINLSAILANTGHQTAHVLLSKADTNLGTFKNPPTGAQRSIDIPPGMSVNAEVDTLAFELMPGHFIEGRIDWLFKYGEVGAKTDQTLRISGALGVTIRDGRPFATWAPDEESARPIGQQPRVAVRSVWDQRSTAKAVTEDATLTGN